MEKDSKPQQGQEPHDDPNMDSADGHDEPMDTSSTQSTTTDTDEPGPSTGRRKVWHRNKMPKPRQIGDNLWECGEPGCDTVANTHYNIVRHGETHLPPQFSCKKCGKQFRRKDKLDAHETKCGVPKPKRPKKRHSCMVCETTFRDRTDYSRHLHSESHKQAERENTAERPTKAIKRNQKATKKKPQTDDLPENFQDEDPNVPDIPDDVAQELKDEIRKKWGYIRTWTDLRRSCCKHYNIRLRPGYDFAQVMREIFDMQDNVPFKLVVEGGFMLERKTTTVGDETGDSTDNWEYNYFYPSGNTKIVGMRTVYDLPSLQRAIDEYDSEKTLEASMAIGPDSRWQFRDMLNVLIRVHPQRRYKMIGFVDNHDDDGSDGEEAVVNVDDVRVRMFLRNSGSVKALERDNNNRPYTDKLCVFRVIADTLIDLGKREGSLNQVTNDLYNEWARVNALDGSAPVPVQNYIGTSIDDLPAIEKLLNIRLRVFECRVDGVIPKRKRKGRRPALYADSDDEADDTEPAEDMLDIIQAAEAEPNPQDNIRELLEDQEAQNQDAVIELEHSQEAPAAEQAPDQPNLPPDPEDDNRVVGAVMLRRSERKTGDRVDALLFQHHFYRVTNVEALTKTWRCQVCNRLFDRHSNCDRHQKKCTGQTEKIYPGGGFVTNKTVWQRLTDAGFPIEEQFYDPKIAYDLEAWFKDVRNQFNQNSSLKFLKKLVPLSASAKSNFTGPEGTNYDRPHFFCDEDPHELIKQLHEHLLDLATAIGESQAAKYQEALQFAKQRAKKYHTLIKELIELRNCEEEELRAPILNQLQIAKQDAKTYSMLKKWVYQVPVIGFNSGKFDLNLMREFLLPRLINTPGDKVSHIIERGSDFMAIATSRLMFLDMIHYLPPGVNLDSFIQSYGPPGVEGKLTWCYEYMDRFSRLDEPFPDDPAAFYSTLRNQAISQEEFQRMRDLYYARGCTCLRDLLEIYNNLDVIPFLQAIDNMANIFRSFGVDMFKSAISLPGVAQRRMFSKQGQTIVPLFSKKYSYWQDLIKNNVVGGPAIVFKRRMEVGDCIRGRVECVRERKENDGVCQCNSLKCAKILGYDANSLYLYCTGCDMPVGIPRIYTPYVLEALEVPVGEDAGVSREECLERIKSNMDKRLGYEMAYCSMYEVPWVLSEVRRIQKELDDAATPPQQAPKLTVKHAYNGGQELFLSADHATKIYVDGYIPEIRTAIELDGCYYHGHNCASQQARIARIPDPAERRKEEWFLRKRYDETMARRAELEAQQITVRSTWECEAMENPDEFLQQTIAEVLPKPPPRNPTAQSIVDQVKDGSFFGVVEVDLQVPWWEPELRQSMQEYPPIFKNATIGRHDVGTYMSNYAVDHNLLKQPRKGLISSYHGTKLCLISPMLKYLIEEKGVVITRVYRAIEFAKSPMFQHITEEVTDLRKRADTAGTDRVAVAKGNVAKLIGNSCYGKCLTNIELHEDIQLMNELDADDAINDPLFSKMDPVDDNNYLVHFSKGKVVFNLPILVAFFVYGYAKKVMLEFYDFLMRHLGPEKFELIESDTDSLYFACSSPTIDEAARDSPTYEQDKPLFIESPETRRQPGLFKLEWAGEAMIALAPKCYYGVSSAEGRKLSMKGVSHRTNGHMSYENYRTVLEDTSQDIVEATNKGFRKVGISLHQYELKKLALTHLYTKRKVLADQISTIPLDL